MASRHSRAMIRVSHRSWREISGDVFCPRIVVTCCVASCAVLLQARTSQGKTGQPLKTMNLRERMITHRLSKDHPSGKEAKGNLLSTWSLNWRREARRRGTSSQ